MTPPPPGNGPAFRFEEPTFRLDDNAAVASTAAEAPLLRVEHLAVSFPSGGDRRARRVQAADGVSLTLFPRQTLAVVGESGSGKSVTALSVLQLIPTPPRPLRRRPNPLEHRPPGGGRFSGRPAPIRRPPCLLRKTDAFDPRQPGRHDLPGADDLA